MQARILLNNFLRRNAHRNKSNFYKKNDYQISLKSIFILFIVFQKGNADKVAYTNDWAVEIDGDEEAAIQLAKEHNFIYLGRIFENDNFYHFKHHSVMKRSLDRSVYHQKKLDEHPLVISAEQQIIKKRKKRDLLDNVPFNPSSGPNDAMWNKMWYLQPSTQPNMKVVEAWKIGATGKDVVVTILDDGIELDHPDLQENYDARASTDINSNDEDPTPRATFNNENRHGTRCAGEVAAVGNNNICSIGIAFHSKIGGVRMLDGDVTDLVESKSIGMRSDYVDIYSASWGPDDDGKTVDGPARLARKAFHDGIALGRQGKGSIFVWASGNGGRYGDNCNCDGYTNSIYTLSISSVTQKNTIPWYSEACSSTLAATYSSGSAGDAQIVTTDLNKQCTTKHTGTSASAPIAAGVCALALEANRDLTWRDMQHIVVQTANPQGLKADDWHVNGKNRKVSHSYGYGLLDAEAMVKLARTWKNVPQQRICTIQVISPLAVPRDIMKTGILEISHDVSRCDDASPMLDKLEHVEAKLSLKSDRRGDIEIHLTSPEGTKSMLLGRRRGDYSSAPFSDWSFMTTHSWDEKARGRWKLEIKNTGQQSSSKSTVGKLTSFVLILYGTINSDAEGFEQTTKSSAVKLSTTISTTTNFTTSTIANHHSPVPEGLLLANCEIPSSSGQKCLVCDATHVLVKDTGTCHTACPPSHYIAYEKVISQQLQSGSKRKTDEDKYEEEQEMEFETSERIGGHVCHPCFDTRLCHTCNGPRDVDCLQCFYGAKMINNVCIEIKITGKPDVPEYSHLKKIVIWICVFSVIFFIILFILFNMCSRWGHNNNTAARYKSVRNDEDESATDDEDFNLQNSGKVVLNGITTKPYSTPINGRPHINAGFGDSSPLIGA